LPPASGGQQQQSQGQQGQAIPVKPSGRFERENAADQLKAMGGEGAQHLATVIDMYGVGYNQPQQQPQAQSAAAQRQPAGANDAKPSAPGSGRPSSSGKPSSSGRPVSGHQLAKPMPAPVDKTKGGIPIIIVPSGR
jgi:hypothetical protein